MVMTPSERKAYNAKRKKTRDYDKEYAQYQGTEEQKKNRAMRNKVRREALRSGKVKKGSSVDIDHKDGNPRNSAKSNTRILSQTKNRGWRKGKKGSLT